MRKLYIYLLMLMLVACSREPQPLVAGKDECSSCKMPVSDVKFGAEIITTKGKIYKFDDLVCMMNYIEEKKIEPSETDKILAMDYTNPNQLLNVNKSYFLKSDKLHSPMNGAVAAFKSKAIAKKYLNEYPGEILIWEDLNL